MIGEIENLRATLILYHSAKKILEQDIKLIVQDKKYPLEERWNLFVESGFGDHEAWVINLDSYNLYNDFYPYCEKYETYSTISLIDWVYENIEENSDGETNQEYFDSILNPIKEEILSLFIRTFKYNW